MLILQTEHLRPGRGRAPGLIHRAGGCENEGLNPGSPGSTGAKNPACPGQSLKRNHARYPLPLREVLVPQLLPGEASMGGVPWLGGCGINEQASCLAGSYPGFLGCEIFCHVGRYRAGNPDGGGAERSFGPRADSIPIMPPGC